MTPSRKSLIATELYRKLRSHFAHSFPGFRLREMLLPALAAMICLSFAWTTIGQTTISDNFNRNPGSDTLWTHYAPLQPPPWNEQVTWTFPDDGEGGKAYRIFGSAPDVPKDPVQANDTGPARVGSFRNDSTYSDFFAGVDIVNFDASIFQNVGFIAGRVTTPGLLTTFGYLAGYATSVGNSDQQGTCALVEFQSELNVSSPNEYSGGVGLVSRLSPSQKYRMVFTGTGPILRAAIYDRFDLLEPIIKIAGSNSDLVNGTLGIGAVNYDGDNDKPTDFTFDNFYSSPTPTTPVGFPGTPQVLNLVPAPQTLFYPIPATNQITFTATTLNTNQVATNALQLFLNNIDVSSGLSFTEVGLPPPLGSPKTNFTVRWNGTLAPGTIYNGKIIVVDPNSKGTTNNFVFDTFVTNGTVLVEAEDYNFGGGQFQDNPPVSGLDPSGGQVSGSGLGYYGQTGSPDIDFHDGESAVAIGNNHQYRPDGVGTAQNVYAGDTPRPDHTAANVPDYGIFRMLVGDWVNYTRTFPAGNRWYVYLRASSQYRDDVRFDQITSDRTQSNQTTASRGNFLVPNTGGSTRFRYVPLTDAAGNRVAVDFSGVNTFRMTQLGGLIYGADDPNGSFQPTYFLFVPTSDPAPTTPWISFASPSANATDVALQPTVTIGILNRSMAVSCPGSIHLRLDGVEVTSSAVIACTNSDGPGATITYTYPSSSFLQPNTAHTISVAFSDGTTTQSNQWSFTTANLPVIPSSFALTASASTNFSIQIHKAPNDGDPDSFPNSSSRAERQLANRIYDPNSGATPVVYTNEAANTPTNYGFYTEPLAINYEQCGLSAGFFNGDTNFPGILPANYDCGSAEGPNHIAMAASIKLSLSPGLYRMGVRSDDGFKVTVGTNDTPVTVGPNLSPALLLGIYEGSRGSSETTFDFVVANSGVYNFRLLYYEGVTSSDVEWYWVDKATGIRTLVQGLQPLQLLSSANVNGPYAPENSAQIDTNTKTITVAKSGSTRFYRLLSTTTAYRLNRPTFSGNNIVLTYQ